MSRHPRIPALDFTKGALVVLMVLYHWLNYFVGVDGVYYRYLRFITPSFIFITGFFVSHIYCSKYALTDTRLPKRLLQRGIKLIAIFLILNLAIRLLPGTSSVQLTDWSLYVMGGTTHGKAAFSILLPIGYLLVLSAILLPLSRFYSKIFGAVCLVLVMGILFASAWKLTSGYLELITIGLLGVNVGYVTMPRINEILRHSYWVTAAYAGYLIAITVWNEIFPLQIVGVCLSLALLYMLGNTSVEGNAIRNVVMLLGQYSLLGYIAQIAILKLLHWGLWRKISEEAMAGIALLLAMALTMACVEAVHRGRASARFVDTLYRAVFA